MSAIPKPASTVILIDQQGKVYLTKRPATMKFLAGHYVFPGGSIDKGDFPSTTDLFLNVNNHLSFSIAHYVAAARELFEEVGILLGCNEDGTKAVINQEDMNHYRRYLLEGKVTYLEIMREHRLVLNCDSFTYIGHKITPEPNPIRFDTRFFIVVLPEGQTPLPDAYEIEEAFWIEPEAALSAYKLGHLKMVRPTVGSLQAVMDYRDNHLLN